MLLPNDYQNLINDLRSGIDNQELYQKFRFNLQVGIKVRKSALTGHVDFIIITWNREKSFYDNTVDFSQKLLIYIGAGLDGKQKIGRQNSTLINYFQKEWKIPVVLCSKIGKRIDYISMLSQSSLGVIYPSEKNNVFRFHFEMSEINYGNLNRLLNIMPGRKLPWKESQRKQVARKKESVKRVIEDQKLRDLIKELQFVGDLGEILVLSYEQSRLISIGLESYAEMIEHTSVSKGHGYGYDIKSFDYIEGTRDVQEIFIEVKSTKLNQSTEFYMTENEYATMLEKKGKYRIYRVYDIYDTQDTIKEIRDPFSECVFTRKTKQSYRVRDKK